MELFSIKVSSVWILAVGEFRSEEERKRPQRCESGTAPLHTQATAELLAPSPTAGWRRPPAAQPKHHHSPGTHLVDRLCPRRGLPHPGPQAS